MSLTAKERERHRKYYQDNKERFRKWREDNHEYLLKQKKAYHQRHREKINEVQRHRRKQIRTEFLAAYGGRCTCCGEGVAEFLTLEHKNGGGAAHRAARGGTGMFLELKSLGWPKNGFTILCWNCNYAVRDGKVCPHKL